MNRAIRILTLLALVGLLLEAQGAQEAGKIDLTETKELLSKPLGPIQFPEQNLDSRINALRAISLPLGIEVTESKGVSAKSQLLRYPPFSLKNGSLLQALQYTVRNTQLLYSVTPGTVHFLLLDEKADQIEP